MGYEFILIILFSSFVILFTIGVPLAFALLLACVTVIIIDVELDILIVPLKIYAGMDNTLLLAIPGFMFAALMMNKIGITEDIVRLSDLIVGRIKGGLAHINIVSSMLMGGVSGSSTADVAGIGSILIPAMKQKGYSPAFAAAITAASSSIGSIIPPSIIMIIYGAAAHISIGALFIAGYIPGILVGLSQLVISGFYAWKYNIDGKSHNKLSLYEKVIVLTRGIIPVSVIAIIIGGILLGIMTPTESSAVASIYVIMVGAIVYRNISIKNILQVASETALLTAIVMLCVGTASLFGWLMSFYGILDVTSNLFTSFATSPILFLSFATIFFLLLGTFMDPAPAILIFAPVLAPIATGIGVNPLQLGILIIMALAIGKITPPYGISLLLACSIAEIPLAKGMQWTVVFFGAFCIILIFIILLPQITLWLPQIFAPKLL